VLGNLTAGVSNGVMRFRLSTALALVVLLVACSTTNHRTGETVDTRFERLSEEFIRTHFDHRPLAAVSLGWHQYDGEFQIRDAQNIAEEIARLRKYDALFKSFQPATLSAQHQLELNLTKATITYERWFHESARAFAINPMTYVDQIDVSPYLIRDFKPLAERFADITSILLKAPKHFEAARKNLAATLPCPFIETAIESANGAASFLEKDCAKAAADLKDANIRAAFDAAMKPAAAAFRNYANWLKNEKLPKSDNSYALGRRKYIEMLGSEFIDLTPEQILERGLRELHAEQERFKAAAATIDPKLTPLEAARIIQRDHPTAAGLIPDTRKNLEEIRQFLFDHHIVTIPSEQRAQVEETLPPFRATSFASMSTPGPFEKKGMAAYYYVTPVEAEWTAKQAEEWLGAFNYYTLDVVSIHEAYPGHYVQFLAWNAAPLSVAQKILPAATYGSGSYAFVEGWAHYCEQMLLEQGFGQPANPATASREERERAAKYRLAQSSEALLRLSRLCCSVKLHCLGATVEDATKFIMDNAYYEEKPAHSEAMRGSFDPGYLYYTLGKLMILKLRDDWKAQEGAAYTLQRFHDELLRHGAPPLPLARQLMLRDPSQWKEAL
jgi:uncharacterized protein (DUF885 family)